MTKTYWEFYGQDIEVILGNRAITTLNGKQNFGLCDSMVISAQENTSRTAIFSFIPPEADIDLFAYQGLSVTILIRVDSGWHPVFAGFVDVASLDFIARKIRLVCNDQRANRIIQIPKAIVQSIGQFDANVFGTVNDQNEELDRRLQTVTASLDFDNSGILTLTSWTPKAFADFTFTSADIKQDSNPTVTPLSRKQTTNEVNYTFNYTYQRLHQQCVSFVWPGYSDFIDDWYSQGKPSFPTITQVIGAATASDWKFINPSLGAITTPLWPAGGYRYANTAVVWQPNKVINQYKQKTQFTNYLKDSTGNFVTVGDPPRLVPQYADVIDSNGNPVMELVSQEIIDTSSIYCRGASFTCALRFSQNVKETYNVNIKAPQSISKFGRVNVQQNITIDEPFDTSTWEKTSTPINYASNLYTDKKNYSKLNQAMQVAYAKAKHDILQVHRDITVTFQLKNLKPELDLIHTVDFSVTDPRSNTASIHAKGKVSAISHNIDFVKETAYTEVSLAISKSDGEETDTPYSINIPTQNPGYIGDPQTIILGTHLGDDPATTLGSEKWTGWIANKDKQNTGQEGIVRTNFTETFIVDFPAIPDSIRNEIQYTAETDLNIAIPNDTIETST